LEDVLRKALASDPDGRFSSVDAFAQALGAASRKGRGEQLPTIDRVVLDGFLTLTPPPLAESAATIESARTAHQLLEAIMSLLDAVAHYLGLYALIGRSRIGSGRPDGDNGTVLEILRYLRARQLRASEWLRLARELTLPFADRAEIFPVPE